ncbi:UNVERIFIED_CONTAM: hypothetical protein Slati_2766900 [Sesamum latifolium]|uniref:RNase H type-1 domain-containing protein n=1 Tax=Sesamum latifolium TaxID=2727402 RepID=A0AAW2W0S8_9LAMI
MPDVGLGRLIHGEALWQPWISFMRAVDGALTWVSWLTCGTTLGFLARLRFGLSRLNPPFCHVSYVSDLILDDTKVWNDDLISAIFWPENRDLICQIPLSWAATSDILVWHYSNNDIFSIQSAYHLALSLASSANTSGDRWDRHMWRKVWQAHIPNKAKIQTPKPVHRSSWRTPPSAWIKINFDGSVLEGGRTLGIGAIARDAAGTCLAWLSL